MQDLGNLLQLSLLTCYDVALNFRFKEPRSLIGFSKRGGCLCTDRLLRTRSQTQ
jgi:hypothetical protein